MGATYRHAETDGDGILHPFTLPVLPSRLRPPRPHVELVARPRLPEAFASGCRPVVVVAAPSGFGKTVALAEWLDRDPRPSAWITADPADDDPLVLLGYVAAALGRVADLDPHVPHWLEVSPPPVTTRILPAIAAAVAAAEPFLLVLDDAHLLTSEAAWQVIGLLVEAMPPGSQLAIGSRAAPPLPLARLAAEGRLREVAPADLGMTPAETAELLRLHGMATEPALAADLVRLTDGWPAGLSLVALAGGEGSSADWPASVRGDRREIARYLASEVLDQQPPAVSRFLLETSILERLSPALCAAVSGDPTAGTRLAAAVRDNLFLSALDDTGEWFRYHHLFAGFLQAELARRHPDAVAPLHARAAAWFEAHGDPEAAVHHWLAAGDARRAGDLVCRAHLDFAQSARHETIRRWLEAFTDEQLGADPALAVAAGFIGTMTAPTPRVRRWLAIALAIRAGEATWPGTLLPVAAMQATLAAVHATDGVTAMRRDAQRAMDLSAGVEPAQHAAAATLAGQAAWLCGDVPAARRILHLAEAAGAAAHCIAQVGAIGTQALLAIDEHRWDEAGERVTSGIRRMDEVGLPWVPPNLPMLLATVRVRARSGDPEAAGLQGLVAAMLAGATIPAYVRLLVSTVLGELELDRGDLRAAAGHARAGLALLEAYPDAGILGARLRRLRDHLDARALAEPLTAAERRVLELLPTELSQKEIAARLGKSPETVRTHVQAVYDKLDVHVRSEAVARARELGLLRDA